LETPQADRGRGILKEPPRKGKSESLEVHYNFSHARARP
jgi:hypothetical protein